MLYTSTWKLDRAISKISVPLDATSFVALRAKYFRNYNGLRSNNVIFYYHDETWTNLA